MNTRYANGKLKPNTNLKISHNNQIHKYKSQANIF